MSEDNFLSRWSRRKSELKAGRSVDGSAHGVANGTPRKPGAIDLATAKAQTGGRGEQSNEHEAVPNAPPPSSAESQAAAVQSSSLPATAPPPTLADVSLLTRDDSYARFVAPGVDPTVRNAAMKKLFTDPHYNVMDGLDIYIDDYGKPDPIPLDMLRRMTQSKTLGLFDHEDEEDERRQLGNSTAPDAATPSDAPAIPDQHQTLPVAETRPDEDPDLQLQPDDGTRRAGAGPGPDEPAAS